MWSDSYGGGVITHRKSGTTCFVDECVHFNGSRPRYGLDEHLHIESKAARYEATLELQRRSPPPSPIGYAIYLYTPPASFGDGEMTIRSIEGGWSLIGRVEAAMNFMTAYKDLAPERVWFATMCRFDFNQKEEQAEMLAEFGAKNENLTLDEALCLALALYEHKQLQCKAQRAADELLKW
jgi:hypothetical protein